MQKLEMSLRKNFIIFQSNKIIRLEFYRRQNYLELDETMLIVPILTLYLKFILKINTVIFYNLKQQKVEFYRIMSAEQLEYDQQPQIAGFIAKTFQILNNQEYSKIIHWGASGKDFIIKDINKFQDIVLPTYFRHKKINSFIRQLNMYGFHKSRKDSSKSIFSHPNFLKGREDLLLTIKRKIKLPGGVLKTPKKSKENPLEKKLPETAVKEQESFKRFPQEPSQLILKGFLESRQLLHSRLNLSLSLKRLSMNQLVDQYQTKKDDDNDDKISLEFEMDRKLEDFKQAPKIVNPSFFFNSFKEYQI